jgi:ribokinase
MTVLCVGDLGLDTTLVVDHLPAADEKVFASRVTEHAGGVVANAARAAVLAGASARLVCAVGSDPQAAAVTGRMRTLDVTVAAETVPGATYRSVITLDAGGEKRLVLVPGVMYPSAGTVRDADLTGVRWVHTAAYDLAAAIALAARCRAERLAWSVDLEPATVPAAPGLLEPLLSGAAAVFCNARAAADLGPDPAQWLRSRGAERVVLTRGAHGARLVDAQRVTDVAGIPAAAPIVDTTGAGDCLAGWFAGRMAAGDGALAALREAVAAASDSCTRYGAQASYPSRAAVLGLLAAASR